MSAQPYPGDESYAGERCQELVDVQGVGLMPCGAPVPLLHACPFDLERCALYDPSFTPPPRSLR